MNKIRILQISKYYFPFTGGTEQVAQDIVKALNSKEYTQKVICFNEDSKNGDYVCHRNETLHDYVDDIEVIRCGCFTKIASQSLSLTYYNELKKIMDEFRPDIIIFHYPNPFVAQLLLHLKKRNFKLILYWHLDITKQKILGKLFHIQNIKLIERANKIVGATPKHINESKYTPYFKQKKQILPYAIDEKNLIITDDERKKSIAIKEKYKNKILGFFIGRHVPYKGLEYLIKASKELDDVNIHFLIAGSGELTESLKRMSKDDPKIEFLGKISDSERRVYLDACDIFCFPSITRNEGFGLALAEGMYYGKPAITFKIEGSGVNYVNLDGITGIECPNRDYHAYAEALKKLCYDSKLRETYGKNARKRIIENFTFESFKYNVNELLTELKGD